ncbi:MAG: ABC transporter ATP-binding protein [Alphaproteobacteria bacterium]|nr:ABC transporter ATP-binding protein [Alphaproteobacteria bacterium]
MTKYFEARSINVHHGQVAAVRDLSMSMDEGEIIALIGGNGAGKTTTLHSISGLKRITNGELWFEGKRIDRLRTDEIVDMGIAMVPEGRQIFPYMSVSDNLLMGAYRRRDKDGIRRDMKKIFELFPRVEERLSQQAGSLSGGEQQMVAIGRALMAKPRLLLLDEPSLGIAPMLVRSIAHAIISINRDQGLSVILVEQNSRLALKISRHAYVLETGRIALSGVSSELAENDHVRRIYLGG